MEWLTRVALEIYLGSLWPKSTIRQLGFHAPSAEPQQRGQQAAYTEEGPSEA